MKLPPKSGPYFWDYSPLFPELLEQLELNLNNDPSIQTETQCFVIAGLLVPDPAFPLHQKTVASYLDRVNGAIVHFYAAEALEPLTDSGLAELVPHLKADGLLSADFEYQPSTHPARVLDILSGLNAGEDVKPRLII